MLIKQWVKKKLKTKSYAGKKNSKNCLVYPGGDASVAFK